MIASVNHHEILKLFLMLDLQNVTQKRRIKIAIYHAVFPIASDSRKCSTESLKM